MFLAGMVLNARVLKLKGDENEYRFGMQEQVGPYRVDFVLEAFGAEVVIEVDGHDFHEKTKKQAAHDKRRDRFLTQQGYAVIHFTGSEVWANPFLCAEEAFAIARAVSLTRGGK
jgi:very-short-patch-repair endonuclease